MLSKQRTLQIFKETGVLQEGHFLLTSGRHSKEYMQCAKVLQYPHFTEELCRELAVRYKDTKIDLVAAPAIGGILIAYEVAKILKAKVIFAERENGKMTFRRGFRINEGERVLVVEDVITTGGSVLEVIEAVKEKNGLVQGVGVFVDRSNGRVKPAPRIEALLQMEIESYHPDQCPLCAQGLPIIKPGSKKTLGY